MIENLERRRLALRSCERRVEWELDHVNHDGGWELTRFWTGSARLDDGFVLPLEPTRAAGRRPTKRGSKLYTELKDRGFVVLGFPSNDFGGQEPGSPDEIAGFCKENYGVTFPITEVSLREQNQRLSLGPRGTEPVLTP